MSSSRIYDKVTMADTESMANKVSHFSINAHDPERALAFYEAVFGWKSRPWGPPGFYMVDTGDEVHGSIQKIQTQPVETFIGHFECTITVDDVDRYAELIAQNGGEVTVPKTTIPGVADIARVKDSEGNVFCLARYL